jgi:hypothetical protein
VGVLLLREPRGADEKSYKVIEEQLDLGKSVIDATIGEEAKVVEFMGASNTASLEHGEAIRAQDATLRELHALLKEQDPGFGGLAFLSQATARW